MPENKIIPTMPTGWSVTPTTGTSWKILRKGVPAMRFVAVVRRVSAAHPYPWRLVVRTGSTRVNVPEAYATWAEVAAVLVEVGK